MNHYNGQWLKKVLAANGYTPEELINQTGLSEREVENVLNDKPAKKDTWNVILTQINNYPTIDYPSDEILQDLKRDIEQETAQARCYVYYGVNSSDLIFCDYTLIGSNQEEGANVNLQMLSSLNLSLQEALELFTKQSLTLYSAD